MIKANSKHEFNSALIGMLLGDGYILHTKNSYCMYVRHGKSQFEYVDEIVEYFSNYIKPRSLYSKVDKKGYPYRVAYYNSKKLKYLYKKIYMQNGKKKKRLSPTIMHRFNAISLAFLYMDDGCLSVRKRNGKYTKSLQIFLCTEGFTKQENIWLANVIKQKFGVNFRVAKEKKYYRLWCSTVEAHKFLKIVSPIVKEFKSMHYKLDIKQEDNPYLN